MRKIREILRLRFGCGYSQELIAKSIGIGKGTVWDFLKRAQKANLGWPLPDDLTDEQLEKNLYPSSQKVIKNPDKQPEIIKWEDIHQELKRKSVTLMLLWHEYKNQHPQGLGYSQFCNLYRQWAKHLDVWMRQIHKAGEKMFVDYAGQTMPVVYDNETGEIKDAQVFVATLGASSFTYVEATWTQTLPDWIGSHVRAFEFFEGCTEIIVPDNLKSGVQKSHIYEPDINPTYQDMAVHYGVAIMPARSKSPKDKAKVENGVLQAERQILAKLRNRVFFSLPELNQAIRPLLDDLNRRPFQKLPGSRLSQFQEMEKPALKPLPKTRYEYAEWKKARVGFNYHIEVGGHYYSIPFSFAKKVLHVRYDHKIVEVFHQNKRVASHIRSFVAHGYTTDTSHMPKNHQAQVEWTPERIVAWGKKAGPHTAEFLSSIMKSRDHPCQGFRACIGVLRLGKRYGEKRLEAACERALSIGSYTFKSVESILKNNLDQGPLPGKSTSLDEKPIPDNHENVRGQNYFK
jgi:transposase